MGLWSVFAAGLLAGGASCAAVQGGLLVAAVVPRDQQPHDAPVTPPGPRRSTSAKHRRAAARERQRYYAALRAQRAVVPVPAESQLLPLVGFLAGKLSSHVMLGAALGAFGAVAQPSFQLRAGLQIAAGAFLLLLAAQLLGAPGLSWLVPSPPAALRRVVRRSARLDAAFAPTLLGFLTILVPCGVTLATMFLAVASGSPAWGAAAMGVFVIGTAPLFAALGFVVRRGANRLRRLVAVGSGVVVLGSGLLSLNTGLVLAGSPLTLSDAYQSVVGTQPEVIADGRGPDGVQHFTIEARRTSYTPSRLRAQADVPTVVTFRTDGNQGCTSVTVIPSLAVTRSLPATGDTDIDLGTPAAGTLRYTCGMGMYSGTIRFTDDLTPEEP